MARKIIYPLIGIGVLIVIVVVTYYGYQKGQSDGQDNGWRDGYAAGYDRYIIHGREDGYKMGYAVGQLNGYLSGLDAGWDKGLYDIVKNGCNNECCSVTRYSLNQAQMCRITDKVTYAEMLRFVREDRTDEIKYADDFNCLGFALTLKANAAKQGIRCAVVILYYENEITGETNFGHAINAFEVTDPPLEEVQEVASWTNFPMAQGGTTRFPIFHWVSRPGHPTTYVDPQFDEIVYELSEGGSYKWYVDFGLFDKQEKSYQSTLKYLDWFPERRWIGTEEAIRRYKEGPRAKAEDRIARILEIW